MLTINQIVKLYYEECVDLKLKRKMPSPRMRGEYDPCMLEVIIYLSCVESKKDRDITILHEFIHARNESKLFRNSDDREDVVEKEAIETYLKRPYVLEFIKKLYRIK